MTTPASAPRWMRHVLPAADFDADAHRRLVAGNWGRTAAWSVRGGWVVCGVS